MHSVAPAVYNYVEANGVKVFYREAGPKAAPIIVLLHGYPTSSNQYRHLIPLLAHKYRVIAPDLPGFGFTEVPKGFKHGFASMANTFEAFLDVLKITKFSVYIFDYGAPTALRFALKRPDAIQAIISQNGNAYDEGLSEGWKPIQKFWATNSKEDRDRLRNEFTTAQGLKWQYVTGTDRVIDPVGYTLDWALMSSPEGIETQLDIIGDYGSNVKLYPEFHKYFQKSQVPLLAVWGKNDPFFIPPGAHAYKKDLPNAEVHILENAGHFVSESHPEELSHFILKFLEKNGI